MDKLRTLFDLTGKTALVTGAAQGLGAVSAKALAAAGANTALTDLSADSLTETRQAIECMGKRAAAFSMDVRSEKSVHAALAEIIDAFGAVDILVNNAGVNHRVPVLEFPEAEWDRIIDTNLKGCFLVARAAAPAMIKRGYGKIINMSSTFGQVALPDVSAYCASKGGVDQLTKAMALEWAKAGVRVNAVGPTYFETTLVSQIRNDPERYRFIRDRIPMGRWGRPDELEGLIIFLAAPASDFITGQTILIDGGWTAW